MKNNFFDKVRRFRLLAQLPDKNKYLCFDEPQNNIKNYMIQIIIMFFIPFFTTRNWSAVKGLSVEAVTNRDFDEIYLCFINWAQLETGCIV